MSQQISSRNSEAAGSRKKVVALAAACASLSAVTVVANVHQHRLLGFACIGVQVVLLVLAIRFFTATAENKSSDRKD